MDYKQIVWLSSWPKSGSTWVRCFLDAYFLGSVDINDLLTSFADNIDNLHEIDDFGAPSELNREIQRLTRPMALLRMIRAHANSGSDLPLIVKTHSPRSTVDGIDLMPQQLTKKIVHLVRDPRDVVKSWARHRGCDVDRAIKELGFAHLQLTTKKKKMATFVGSWSNSIKSLDGVDLVKTFRYEDIKRSPVESFADILKHIGVTPDISKVVKAIELTSLRELQKQEDKNGFKESSPHSKDQFFGRTHTILSQKQNNLVIKKCKDGMRRFGYIK